MTALNRLENHEITCKQSFVRLSSSIQLFLANCFACDNFGPKAMVLTSSLGARRSSNTPATPQHDVTSLFSPPAPPPSHCTPHPIAALCCHRSHLLAGTTRGATCSSFVTTALPVRLLLTTLSCSHARTHTRTRHCPVGMFHARPQDLMPPRTQQATRHTRAQHGAEPPCPPRQPLLFLYTVPVPIPQPVPMNIHLPTTLPPSLPHLSLSSP